MKTWMYLVKTGNIILMKQFLYHVLNGLIIDEYRKHKSVSLDRLSDGGFEPGEDSTTRMIDQLDAQQAIGLIRALPPAYQQTMKLRYVEGLSLADISAQTNQTKNAIAVKLHRGTHALRSLYALERSIRSPLTM